MEMFQGKWVSAWEGADVRKALEICPVATEDIGALEQLARLGEAICESGVDSYLPPTQRSAFRESCIAPEIAYALALSDPRKMEEWPSLAREAVGRLSPFLGDVALAIRRAREAALSYLLDVAERAGLPLEDRGAMEACLAEGDDAEAYEVMCSSLFADGILLPRELVGEIESLGRSMGADPWMWGLLRGREDGSPGGESGSGPRVN